MLPLCVSVSLLLECGCHGSHLVHCTTVHCTTCTDNDRALQTLSKNSLNTMGRLVGLGARQWEAIWAIPGGEAGIWGMGEDRR